MTQTEKMLFQVAFVLKIGAWSLVFKSYIARDFLSLTVHRQPYTKICASAYIAFFRLSSQYPTPMPMAKKSIRISSGAPARGMIFNNA